jgi:succinoglycan biosynthesis protein ExoL
MRVTYFANDLSDATVARRVRMLRIGGADVKLLGFRRSALPVYEVEGIAAVDLGRTFDGRLGARCAQVLQRSLEAVKWRDMVSGADVVLARNLEMVTIADIARVWAGSDVRLAYECLDIHKALLENGPSSRLLRSWERRALSRSASLIVSSHGFLTNYFERLGVDLPNVILAENKRVLSEAGTERPQCTFSGGRPPWRIGWFGNLRCVESFRMLMGLARRHPGFVDVEMRGRPTQELQNQITEHLPLASMRFGGPYAENDLVSIYGTCDMTWAIDYSQHGQNSDWLLPNRIYEGGYYNIPAIALAGTETAAWLKAREAGILLHNPHVELDPFITSLTPAHYRVLQRSSADVPTRDLVWTIEDCRQFACRITGN